MHELKVSALSAQDRYHIARVHCNAWYINNLVLLTYPKQPLVFESLH